MKKQDEGFTLIELLIVIVILGILATVVVFAVGGITDKGEVSACKADYKTLEVAVEAYRAQEGGYPATAAQLTTGTQNYLRSQPAYFDVGGAGSLVAASGVTLPTGCP